MAEKKKQEKRINKKEKEERKIEDLQREKREKQAIYHNKLLRTILIIVGLIVFAAIVYILVSNSLNNFTYRGVKFQVTKFCDSGPPCLITYQTSIPVQYQGKTVPYNFYLRNDPRKLNVPFNGTIVIKPDMVLNFGDNLTCNGTGILGSANLVQLYKALGVNVISDQNASCDLLGRYMYVNVFQGNTTSIEKNGPVCYSISINNCEMLPGTEEFMIQTFIKVNQLLKNQSIQQ